MTDTDPFILTNKEHIECEARWQRWKVEKAERANFPGIYGAFELAEASVRAFGPHVEDVPWLDQPALFRSVYGCCHPIGHLLDLLDFPAESESFNRGRYMIDVRRLILEHEDYSSGDSGYMPRSVILGWIVLQHDHVLGDISEAA